MKRVWVLAAVLSAWGAQAVAQTVVAPAAAPNPSVAQPPAAQVSAQPPTAPVDGSAPLAGAVVAAAPQGSSASDGRLLAAGTVVEIELTDPVSSQTALRGNKFGLKLAEPIILGGRVVVPAGASGMGQVVFAQQAGLMGAAGKLVLAARYVDFDGQRLALHAFKLSGGGEDREVATFVAGMVAGPIAILIPGGGVVFPIGTRATAKLATDVVLTDPASPVAAAPAQTQTSTVR